LWYYVCVSNINNSQDKIVDFLFEVGILSKTPRSGFHFLGSGQQSVAEHNNRVVFIGYTLATLTEGVDVSRVMKMCLFHDLPEGRTSDLNYVHQKYAEVRDDEALRDLTKDLPFGDEMYELYEEYEKRESLESKLAKDADQLEWILSLKEQADTGNARANTWLPPGVKRLLTPIAQQLATKILLTNSDDWWFSNKQDSWWVNRNKNQPAENLTPAPVATKNENEIVLQVGTKIAIQNELGQILLVKRNPQTYPEVVNPWDIIGGRIDTGSELEKNLAREVKEETNLNLVGTPKLLAAQDILRVPGRHVVRLTYLGQATGEIKLDSKEHSEFRWVNPNELHNIEGLDEYFSQVVQDNFELKRSTD